MTVATLPLSSFDQPNALSIQIKKRVALEALRNRKTITRIAQENNTSRKYVRQQRDRALEAIDKYFELDYVNADDVLFYLPVTKAWITQFVLSLMLLAHASYRNVAMIIKDLLDCDISQGSINKIFNETVDKAKVINSEEDLSSIKVTANDELFHLGKPILTGIDTRSLYCYMLNSEDHRDEDTWVIRLLYAKDKGLNPQRTIGDDAKGLVAGHKKVFSKASYDYDNFHISQALMNLRRFFRNRLKTAINELNTLKIRANKSVDDMELAEQVILAKKEEEHARNISTTLDTLISWLEHDILNKAGPTPNERRELYDFVVDEFKKLELIEPHRITEMRITLENKREMTLAFSEVLNEKFKVIGEQFNLPIDVIWEMCKLQRCDLDGVHYIIRSVPLEQELGGRFDEVEDSVIKALDETERTSSMVENLNGRVRNYIRNRKEIGHGYLDLLRCFLNHKPIVRSARTERHGKSPAEILAGKPHAHWLELFGFERFKRAA